MKAGGVEATEEQMAAGVARMRLKVNGEYALFAARDITEALVRSGVPAVVGRFRSDCWVAMRIADRLIQQERRAGNIVLERPLWRWIGEAS